MTTKEKEILKVFGKAIPNLSEIGKERLLAFGEGMVFKLEQDQNEIPVPTSAAPSSEKLLAAR